MAKTQQLESEQGVLGGIILDNTLFDEISLSADDFSVETNRQIFEAIQSLMNQSKPVDIITVASYIEQVFGSVDMEYIGELVRRANTSAKLIREYGNLIKKATKARKARDIALQLQYSIEHDECEEFVDQAVQGLMALNDSDGSYEATLKETLTSALERLDFRFNNQGLPGLSSGIEELDKTIGGFRDNKLYVFAGRPAKGKTALMMNFINHLLIENIPSIMFSLEMEKEEIADRLISINGSVNSHRMSTGNFAEDDFPRITAGVQRIQQSSLRIIDQPNIPIVTMMRAARKAKQRDKIRAVFVDYIQITRGTSANQKTLERITEVTQLLKQMARELKVPVIALAQLNREADNLSGPAGMSYLADASAIEKDADFIATLYASEEMERDGRLLIHACKNRGGPKGDVMTKYERQYYRITQFGRAQA